MLTIRQQYWVQGRRPVESLQERLAEVCQAVHLCNGPLVHSRQAARGESLDHCRDQLSTVSPCEHAAAPDCEHAAFSEHSRPATTAATSAPPSTAPKPLRSFTASSGSSASAAVASIPRAIPHATAHGSDGIPGGPRRQPHLRAQDIRHAAARRSGLASGSSSARRNSVYAVWRRWTRVQLSRH